MQLHIIENNKNNYNQLYNKCGIVRIHIQNNTLFFLINNDTLVSNDV
jgi:hypothetical protein